MPAPLEPRPRTGAPDLLATTDGPALEETAAAAAPTAAEETTLGPTTSALERARATISVRGAAQAIAGPPTGPPTLRGAARIGRYAVLSELGEGGMGVVLSGYDEVLERRVAIKLVRGHHRGDERLQARLLREAQALARLSHPNVVQVYEAGAAGDELYLVMEFVRGVTLSAWLSDQDRGAEQIVDVFVQAGHGLAAAHRAGLVHRDFKPTNVLVDLEGRVRVVDFGLAALTELPERPHDGPLDQTLGLAGTPAYMAPEQWLGGQVDARSDQYSFCVALWEALYGARPFVGPTLDDLRQQVTAGDLPAQIPLGPRLPPRLHRALTRGLARDPDARWPTMDALLVELAPAPRRARGAALVAGTFVAAALVAGLAWTLAARDRCDGGEARLAGVWDDARRADAREAFLAADVIYADAAWDGASRRLDAHAAELAAMHRAACEATHVRGGQSERLLDLRMACLSRQVEQIRAVTDLLVTADASVVERAVDAVAALPPTARCADAEALLADVPPPDDPRVALAVAAVRRDLAGLAALERLGRYDHGLSATGPLVAAAEATGYGPVVAEAELARGRLLALAGRHDAAESALTTAFNAALAVGHHDVARDAAARLVDTVNQLGRFDDADVWSGIAAAALARAPDPDAAAFLDFAASRLAWSRGRYPESEALIERSVAAYDALYGPDNPAAARARQWLGTALWARQDFERSKQLLPDGRARLERIYGPDHPEVAAALRYEGGLYFVLTDFDTAVARWRRGLDIIVRTRGPDDPLVPIFHNNIAAAYARAGKAADSLAAFEAALAARERTLGPDHPDLLAMIDNLAAALMSAGQTARARATIDRAIALRRRAIGEGNPDFARSLLALGEWAIVTGDFDLAIPTLERALVLRRRTDVHAILRGRAEDLLGRALWLSERDPGRARQLLDAAAATFAALGPAGSIDLAALQEWRKEHGLEAMSEPP